MSTTPLFHSLRVKRITPDTQEAVVVTFDVPDELRGVFGFTQGQYLTLRKEIDGQDLRRSYSICAGVDDGELRVGVRKVRGGVFSNWINERRRDAFSCRSSRRCGGTTSASPAAAGSRRFSPS
jgi:ring-1,2-phenylacetyl-CoA epoxidase subunit PaaE